MVLISGLIKLKKEHRDPQDKGAECKLHAIINSVISNDDFA